MDRWCRRVSVALTVFVAAGCRPQAGSTPLPDHQEMKAEVERLRADQERMSAELKQMRAAVEEERQKLPPVAKPPRPMRELLVGNWSAADSNCPYRGLTIGDDKHLSGFCAFNDGDVRPARFNLVGQTLEFKILFSGSFDGANSTTSEGSLNIVRVTEQELVFQSWRPEDQKKEPKVEWRYARK